MWLGVVALAVVFLMLHRKQRLPLLVGVAGMVAAVASAGVWYFVVRTTAMPRAMTATHQKDEGIHRLLGISSRELFLTSERGITRVELPSLRVTYTLPWKGSSGVVTNLAWNGRVLFVFAHDGEKSQMAILSSEGWVMPPRDPPQDDAYATVYWDAGAHAFVVGSRGKNLTADEPFRTRRYTFIDETGKELRSFDNVGPIDLTGPCGLCVSGSDLVGTTAYSTCRTKYPAAAESTWTCEKSTVGTLPECPTHFSGGTRSPKWFGPAGVQSHAELPASFTGAWYLTAFAPEVLLHDDGSVEPWEIRHGEDLTTLIPVTGGYVRYRLVDETEAVRRGHTHATEAILARYDETGKLVAQGEVLRAPIFARVVEMGGEIALVSDQVDTVARFDRSTMARLDGPDAVTALRDRLERWGGPSALFRAFVMMGLAVLPLLLFAIFAWQRSRTRPDTKLSRFLPRLFAVLAVVAASALVMIVSRFYEL